MVWIYLTQKKLWERGRLENTRRSQDNIKNAVNKLYGMTWYGFIWLKKNLWERGRLENKHRSQDNIKNAVNKLYDMTWYGFIWLKKIVGKEPFRKHAQIEG